MATGRFFIEVRLPEQKSHGDGVLFPMVLTPLSKTKLNVEKKLCDFLLAIKAEKPLLESLVKKRGVILFRGFPVITPSDFNDVVEAFDFPPKLYIGGRGLRSNVIGRIMTVDSRPPEIKIPFHHEMSYLSDFPSKLFFFCEEEPGSGGETPIVLSHIVYEKMKEKHPEFVAKLEEHGLTYTKLMSDEDHPSLYAGRGWKSTYMTNDKNVAEERAEKQGTKLEWIGNTAKSITGPMPAIRFDKENQRKTWFNSMVVGYNDPRDPQHCDVNISTKLANGEPLSDTVMQDCLRIMEEECVAIPWKKGDVMLVNNLMVLHSRRPLVTPPRQILVSLCK
ncbi:hypothetical protein Lser_V15G18033 [Lactuca serriola]